MDMIKQYQAHRFYSLLMNYSLKPHYHTDTKGVPAVTLLYYANLEWNPDWGGETMFTDDNDLNKIVKCIGYKKNPYPYIKKSDIFVLSSLYEGLPNVLLEAIYLKKYIISSDCPTGPKEILENGKYGSLFKIKDYNYLAYLLLNFKYKKNKINNAYKSIKRFDFNSNCQKYYKSILKII